MSTKGVPIVSFLKELMRRRKLLPSQLASDLGISHTTASLWAVLKANPLQQAISVVDFQLGTAIVEKPIVEKEKCASCHLGADSGKFYFRHIDPAQPGQTGNWALDQAAVTICKTCHGAGREFSPDKVHNISNPFKPPYPREPG